MTASARAGVRNLRSGRKKACGAVKQKKDDEVEKTAGMLLGRRAQPPKAMPPKKYGFRPAFTAFLLFAGALHVELGRLRSRAVPVIVLATFGTAVSTLIVGVAVWQAAALLGQPLTLAWAMVFGALISPTDPVADIHPVYRERVLEAISSALNCADGPFHVEYRIVGPDGRTKWLEAQGRVLHEASGKPARMVGICMNVSDKKTAAVHSCMCLDNLGDLTLFGRGGQMAAGVDAAAIAQAPEKPR